VQEDSITIGLGLPTLRVLGQKELPGLLVVTVVYRREERVCPRCSHVTAKVHQYHPQWKQDCSLGPRRVLLRLLKRRFRCAHCGKVFSEPDEVCGWRRRSTRRFRAQLAEEARWQTVKRVAEKEEVSQGLVQRAYNQAAQGLLEAQGASPGTPRWMALDEFSVRKGHRYQTAICDLEQRKVLEVVEGHKAQSAQAYLEKLADPDRVEAVVMDMHEPYRQVVELCCPRAKIVVDKYHLVRKVNQVMDRVRIRLQRGESRGRKSLLYRKRYLLLKGAEKLSEEETRALGELLAIYPELAQAWRLKEAFRAWYRLPDRKSAAKELFLWEKRAMREGPLEFRGLWFVLSNWREEILNYFDHRLTNGFLEGKNNRIKVIMRTAYGYRNMDNLRLRILMSNRTSTMATGPYYHTI